MDKGAIAQENFEFASVIKKFVLSMIHTASGTKLKSIEMAIKNFCCKTKFLVFQCLIKQGINPSESFRRLVISLWGVIINKRGSA